MMRPPTLPHPNPSAETVRPVLPRLRDSMARCPFAHPTRSSGTICRRSRCCQVSVMVSKSQPTDGNDVDWINDSAKALCLALPPRAAARLAVATSEAVDRRVEGLSDELVAANAAAGHPINLLRAEHRREHLDEIEHALA